MSFFEEFKRRNVFRVAAAYLVAAWLIIQIVDVIGPIMDLPDWFPRTTLVVLAIGFPAALMLAWAFELTPEGIKHDADVDPTSRPRHRARRKIDVFVMVVLTVAVTFFALDRFVRTGSPTTAADDRYSIAVLPFRSISPTPGREYFAEGLAEELINLLARAPELKVIGRTSSFAFGNRDVDVRTIGQVLGVRSVLEGSVRIVEDRLRVSARLINTNDASPLWSNDYDRVLSDVFAVQDEVAASIMDALQLQLGGAPSRGTPTDNSDAYQLFLRARFELNSFLFKEAEDTLLSVLQLDPEFAEAHELLSYVYWFLSATVIDAAEGQQLVRESAARALEINPDLTIAAALFIAASPSPDAIAAEIEELEQALTVQPNDSRLMDILVFRLVQTGYLQEAVTVAERFVEVDPISAVAHNRLSEAYYAAGRVEDAFASAMLVNELDQTSGTAYWNLAHMSLAEERYEDAIQYFELFMEQYDLEDVSWVRELITEAREPERGLAVLEESIPEILASLPSDTAFETSIWLNSLYLYFGGVEQFIDYIFEYDIAEGAWTNADVPIWQGTLFRDLGFTAHPRYLEVAESLGFTTLWEERGPPDFCRRSGQNWNCI